MAVTRIRLRNASGENFYILPSLVVSAYHQSDDLVVKTIGETYRFPWSDAVNSAALTSLQSAPVDKVNTGLVTVDFGSGNTNASTVVTGQKWVVPASRIAASLQGTTADHSSVEDGLLEQITAAIGTLVESVGFTLHAHAPNGAAGQYTFACIGD